jgi:hypothetical protein
LQQKIFFTQPLTGVSVEFLSGKINPTPSYILAAVLFLLHSFFQIFWLFYNKSQFTEWKNLSLWVGHFRMSEK